MSKVHVIDRSDQQALINKAFGERISRDRINLEISQNPVTLDLFNSFSNEDREKIIAFLAGERTLQILSDKFFKKILDPEFVPERVESLISAIYGQKVKIIEVLPKEGIIITEGGSQVIMDIIIRLGDGSITTVEMQRLGYLFPGERSSCYVADMLMRQYERVRSQRGKDFSYKDLKNVNLIVIMEESSREFKEVSPKYIHKREVSFDSGARVKTLENITYISLDTFRKKKENEVITPLDEWLTFFTAETPEEVLNLINRNPDFLPMYEEITEYRKSPEEVISMFSEALKIMDRNTTKYMIDELHEQIESQKQTIMRIQKENVDQHQTIMAKDQTITDQHQTIMAKDQTITDQHQTITDLQQTVIKLTEHIAELEKEVH